MEEGLPQTREAAETTHTTWSYHACAIVVVILFAAQAALAQTIQGKVIVHFTEPPEHVELVLEVEGQPIQRSYADSSGAFFLRGMPFGAYELVARSDGFTDSRTRVELSAGPGGISDAIVLLQLERQPPEAAERVSPSLIDVIELKRNYPKKILQEFEKGVDESRKRNPAKAVKHLEAVVKEAPDFYDAHNALGVVYQELNRFRDAEREFNVASTLNPESALPWANLGNLYVKENNLSAAEKSLLVAVSLNSQSAVAFYLLGLAYYKANFNAEAEKNLLRALDLEPHMPAARLALLNLYARLERWDSALENLDAYLAENPKAPNRAELQAARVKVIQNQQK